MESKTNRSSTVKESTTPIALEEPVASKELVETSSDKGSTEKDTKKKDEKDAPPEIPPVSFFQLFRFHTKLEIFLNIIGVIAATGSGAAQPLMTLVFGNLSLEFVEFGRALQLIMVDPSPENMAIYEGAADGFREASARNALYFVYIGIAMCACTYTYMVIWTWTSEKNAKRIREAYLKAILRQNVAYFDNVGAGEVATRIQTDTHMVHLGISEKFPIACTFVAAFIGGFIIAFIRSWKLTLALSSILPCIMIFGAAMNYFVTKYKAQQLTHIAASGTIAEEVVSTIRTAHAFGIQKPLGVLYNDHVEKAHLVENKLAIVNGVAMGFMFFVIYGAYGLAFHFGTTLILSGEIDLGILINVFFSIVIGSFSVAMLAPNAAAVTTGMGAAAKLWATIDRVPEIDSADPSGLKPEKITGKISVKDIVFRYPSRPDVPVLQGVSIDFEAGKTAALVGASGSGKSTIVALIERFYDPIEGQVLLDDVNIKDINLKWLRSQIGLVSQEPILFATTIRANVEAGMIGSALEHADPETKLEAVKAACFKSNADGFIQKLPNGYDTLVGERGFLLSGGQKQRIAIARAIASDPSILLLDEATSALDTRSEGIVQDALDKAAAGRTTIVIAHRLSTIKDADQIYVMGDGKVLEHGTHRELLASSGPYARLVQAQKLREETSAGNETPLNEKEEKDVEAPPEDDEKVLYRTGTSRSLASQILEQRKAEKGDTKPVIRSIPYLLKRLAIMNKDAKWLYLWGTIAAAIGGMVYPIFGIIYAKAMDDFTLEGHALRVAGDRNALWFFVISLGASSAMVVQSYSFIKAGGDLTAKLRVLGFAATLRQDIAYFDESKNSSGAVTSSLGDNPQKINGLAGVTLGSIVGALFTLLGGSIVGLVYSWKLALVAIACIPTTIAMGYVELRVVVMKDENNKASHELSAQIACEAASAIRTVASLTREDEYCKIYSESLEVPLRASNRTAFTSTALYGFMQSTIFFVNALVFWYGSRLVADLEVDIFEFFVVLMAVTFGGGQAGNIFAFTPDISQSKVASNALIDILDSKPDIDAESTEGKVHEQAKGRIQFKDVHFRYPTRPGVRVLRDFNLTVEPGTHVALVGASGCGKSTVIQLVERFYDPLSGTILLDYEPITDLNISEYRKHLALVSQEPTLYAGTIKFNILLGAIKPEEQVTQEELEAACKDANILDFIQSLPDGFETQVGGKGNQLSGGQKQRIAIARALLRNPTVLLLDEATSALDSNSERVVQDALDRASKGRTTISIAHRLSSIQECDKIHFVQDGRIVESGTHNELLKLNGKYAEFVLLQDLSGRT